MSGEKSLEAWEFVHTVLDDLTEQIGQDARDERELLEGLRVLNRVTALCTELSVDTDPAIADDRIINVRFADFMHDPFSTIRTIYRRLGRELAPVAEQRMREHLSANPGDGGGNRYTWADTGLDAAELREKVAAYQERYDVPTEALR